MTVSNGHIGPIVYADAPKIVYWEATAACDLACRHCRAEAMPNRAPDELSTREGRALLDQVKSFGDSMIVITGGDPLKRPDLIELITYAKSISLPLSLSPSGTNNITEHAVNKFKSLDVLCISLSIDGHDAKTHDTFRQVNNCFETTVNAAKLIVRQGIQLQVNTSVTKETAPNLPHIFDLVEELGAARWSVFFLVPVGLGKLLEPVSPEETEEILNWLYEKAAVSKVQVKTTEAHHFRRVIVQRMLKKGMTLDEIMNSNLSRGFGIRDGNGVVFVSRNGEVFPSGFLPLSAGNVRKRPLTEIYRDSQIFKAIRDTSNLRGKCGMCPFKNICGGSRARAYCTTGDYLASDPLCAFNPLI